MDGVTVLPLNIHKQLELLRRKDPAGWGEKD